MNQRLAHAHWRKSSHSGANGQCVEVATNLPGIVAIRDSKDHDRPALIVDPRAWTAFLNGIQAGQVHL